VRTARRPFARLSPAFGNMHPRSDGSSLVLGGSRTVPSFSLWRSTTRRLINLPKSSRRVIALSIEYVEVIPQLVVSELWPAGAELNEERLKRLVVKAGRAQGSRIADRHLLASALGRPFQTAFGMDLYPTIPDKAAALFHSLISNHPFPDGNKRTAILVTEQFFVANGYWPLLSSGEMYDTAKQIASYRERGVTHEAAYQSLCTLFAATATPIRQLKGRLSKDAYAELRQLPRLIRSHPLIKSKSRPKRRPAR
jgi:death-on-curing protein